MLFVGLCFFRDFWCCGGKWGDLFVLGSGFGLVYYLLLYCGGWGFVYEDRLVGRYFLVVGWEGLGYWVGCLFGELVVLLDDLVGGLGDGCVVGCLWVVGGIMWLGDECFFCLFYCYILVGWLWGDLGFRERILCCVLRSCLNLGLDLGVGGFICFFEVFNGFGGL